MADFWDISGVILGALGILALFQLVWQGIDVYLPTELLKTLDDVLDEADTAYRIALEDGLPVAGTEGLSKRLQQAKSRTELLRIDVYCAITTWQQVQALFSGLSARLLRHIDKCEDLRSDVLTAVEKARVNLELQNIKVPFRTLPYVPPSARQRNPVTFHVAQPFSSFFIPEGYQAPTPP